MTEDNKKLVEQFIHHAWGKGRYHVIRQMIARDFLYHACQSMSTNGIEVLIDEIDSLRKALGDFDLVVEDILGEDDRVISVMTLCGSFNKPVFGIAPNFKAIGITCAITWQLQRGRIRHMNVMIDMANIQRQLAAA